MRLNVTQDSCPYHRCSDHKRRNAMSKAPIAVEDEHLYTRESSQKSMTRISRRFVNIRHDGGWVLAFRYVRYVVSYIRYVRVSSNYRSGDVCVVLM